MACKCLVDSVIKPEPSAKSLAALQPRVLSSEWLGLLTNVNSPVFDSASPNRLQLAVQVVNDSLFDFI